MACGTPIWVKSALRRGDAEASKINGLGVLTILGSIQDGSRRRHAPSAQKNEEMVSRKKTQKAQKNENPTFFPLRLLRLFCGNSDFFSQMTQSLIAVIHPAFGRRLIIE